MLLSDIKHKTTLKGIIKHNITDKELQSIPSIHDLHIHIRRCSRRLWQAQNRQYFKDKYADTYKQQIQTRNYLKQLPVNYV
jgi:hypothetical protein